MSTESEVKEIFEDQEKNEEVVEIDSKGNVHAPGEAPRDTKEKPTIFRDTQGEYSSGGNNERNTC